MIKYVIALDGSQRIDGFCKQPYAQDFHIWQAYNGYENPIPEFVNLAGLEKCLRRKPSLGEIGCSISHYLVCKNFVENHKDEDFLLVAEDDARFHPKTPLIINRSIKITDWKRTGIIVFSGSGLEHGIRKFTAPEQGMAAMSVKSLPVGWAGRYPFILGKFDGNALGAGLYLISRTAAEKLVDYVERESRLSWPSDHYHVWVKPLDIGIKIVRPGLCSWEGESTIGGQDHDWSSGVGLPEKEDEPFYKTFYRELFLKERFRRFMRSLKV
ncbi:glycosyltransferase family 25 protein [Rothia sp. 32237D007AR]